MRKNLKQITKTATTVVLAILTLSSCAATGVAEESRKAGLAKGVRICVTNDSPKPVRLDWWEYDTHDSQETLSKGQTACGEGTTTWLSYDVAVLIQFRDSQSQSFYFGNGWWGYPQVMDDPDKRTAADTCGLEGVKGPNGTKLGFAVHCSDGYGVNEERFYPSGTKSVSGEKPHLVSVTRLKDTGWIEFQATVEK